MMNKEELLVEIERHGGKIEPIKQVCQFETFGKSIFDRGTVYNRAHTTPSLWHLVPIQPRGWASNTLGILIAIAEGG
jgi:hypothetical protein